MPRRARVPANPASRAATIPSPSSPRHRCQPRGTPLNASQSQPRKLLDWRPPTPFFYGWLVLGMASLSTAAGSSVSQVVLGAIQVYIIADTGWDIRTLSLAVTAGTWCSGALAPLAGYLADRYGPRVLVTGGLLVVGSALIALSQTNSLLTFFAAYIVGRAISNPFLIGSSRAPPPSTFSAAAAMLPWPFPVCPGPSAGRSTSRLSR